MRISKRTWHYRNWRCWVNRSSSRKARNERYRLDGSADRPQPNLCLYVRVALIWGPMKRFGRWLDNNGWFVFIVIGVFWYAMNLAVFWEAPFWGGTFKWYAGFVNAIIGAVFLFIMYYSFDLVGWIHHKYKYRGVDREPPLLIEYVKAKKRKVCPLLEFED